VDVLALVAATLLKLTPLLRCIVFVGVRTAQ
jgi:hypothetical protein